MEFTLPKTMKQIFGTAFSADYRSVLEIRDVPLPELATHELLIKNRFVGVNAADLLLTSKKLDIGLAAPYPFGIEGVGIVVNAGNSCQDMIGLAVAYINVGAYAEYTVIAKDIAFVLPEVNQDYLSMLVSGLTAAISLDKVGHMKKGETVLVTAASGGTGQFAVQLAKLKGCQVIGTCSSEEKAENLKKLGCDRPVIYTKEDLNDVLSKEFPKGVDIVYDCVGGNLLTACCKNLCKKGRIIGIGSLETYVENSEIQYESAPEFLWRLFTKAGSYVPFLLFDELSDISLAQRTFKDMIDLYRKGKLVCNVDQGDKLTTGPFVGIDRIVDAIDYLCSKKSMGKVFVELNPDNVKS